MARIEWNPIEMNNTKDLKGNATLRLWKNQVIGEFGS